MGNINSKTLDEWSAISIREPEKTNEDWKRIFRYGFGAIGGGSAVISWLLIIKWLKQKQVGGLSSRNPNMLTKGYLNWHIFAMSTSFLLLMSPSIITFEVWPLTRSLNKNIHYYLNTLALLSSMIGWAIIIDCHHNLSQGGSIRSVHGVTGYFTLSLLLINWLAGFIMYIKGKGGPLRGTLKPLHKRLGLMTLIMGLANICIGLMEKQAAGRYDVKTQRLTHTITALVLLSLFSLVSSVAKFDDKADPPQPQIK